MGDMDIEGLQDARDILRHVFYVCYGCCSHVCFSAVCFGSSSKSVSVSSDEVIVVVVL